MQHVLGLTSKERARYSLTRAVLAMASGGPTALAGFEAECAAELERRYGVQSQRGGLLVPADVLYAQRDLTAASGAGGGYLKDPTGVAAPFAAALRQASWLEKLPVQRMVDLKADTTLPRHGSNVTTTWLGTEGTGATEQTPSFGAVAFTPKTAAIVVERSRQHLLQTPQHDAQLQRELGLSVGVAIGAACANGSGASGEPLGVLGQTTQSVSGTSLSWANTAEAIRLCEAAGGGDGLAALVGTGTAKALRMREKAAGSGFILADGRIGDLPAVVDATLPADALLIGNYGHAVYAEWGPLEILATNFASATNHRAGIIAIRAIVSIDFGLVHPAAFCKATGVS